MSETRTIEDIARDDLKGSCNEDEAAWLRSGEVAKSWRSCLVTFKQDVEKQFALRKADLGTFQQECMRRGESGKQDYFQEKADHEEWKAQAGHYKCLIEKRIQEAKKIIAELSDSDSGRDSSAAVRIADALERIADALESRGDAL